MTHLSLLDTMGTSPMYLRQKSEYTTKKIIWQYIFCARRRQKIMHILEEEIG